MVPGRDRSRRSRSAFPENQFGDGQRLQLEPREADKPARIHEVKAGDTIYAWKQRSKKACAQSVHQVR
ncbi:MAG: hypothetical protein AMJ93_03080 [Anaerolineae bacterium SM23_84]|nr:MAG: hypothetical protein AMJ93_03080 [Anaerolineae bacterium SM23_84]